MRRTFQTDSILRRDPRGLVNKSHFGVRFGEQTPTPCFTNHFIFPSNNFKAKSGLSVINAKPPLLTISIINFSSLTVQT